MATVQKCPIRPNEQCLAEVRMTLQQIKQCLNDRVIPTVNTNQAANESSQSSLQTQIDTLSATATSLAGARYRRIFMMG